MPGNDDGVISNEPKRRVSIITDPVMESRMGHDNLGFEPNTKRKISQVRFRLISGYSIGNNYHTFYPAAFQSFRRWTSETEKQPSSFTQCRQCSS